MIPPFTTFGEDERPDNPLVQDMLTYMNDDSLYTVNWDFATFPSQEFKTSLEAYLLEYAQGSMEWDDVVKKTIDCWASEKALIALIVEEHGQRQKCFCLCNKKRGL